MKKFLIDYSAKKEGNISTIITANNQDEAIWVAHEMAVEYLEAIDENFSELSSEEIENIIFFEAKEIL